MVSGRNLGIFFHIDKHINKPALSRSRARRPGVAPTLRREPFFRWEKALTSGEPLPSEGSGWSRSRPEPKTHPHESLTRGLFSLAFLNVSLFYVLSSRWWVDTIVKHEAEGTTATTVAVAAVAAAHIPAIAATSGVKDKSALVPIEVPVRIIKGPSQQNTTSKMYSRDLNIATLGANEIIIAASDIDSEMCCWDLLSGAVRFRLRPCASSPHAIACVGGCFFAASQVRKAASSSVFYWPWNKVLLVLLHLLLFF
ncbi:ROOT INITIATION DEFECTIVE 3 protein [Nymphaea thermarum]|nr:ROOT INITIATION DEFECTIVE 3 protein [Nymphaea thermarum]